MSLLVLVFLIDQKVTVLNIDNYLMLHGHLHLENDEDFI
jgi:hypothetical protein